MEYKTETAPIVPGKHGPLIGAIDQGTSSTRFLVFAAGSGEVLTYHQQEVAQQFPAEGWVEQCPLELLRSVRTCLERAVENLGRLSIAYEDIKAVGIANQRETTIVWDKHTGQPLYNAIVWLDSRTASTVEELTARAPHRDGNALRTACGLPLSTYFSALKLRWLLDRVPSVAAAAKEGRLMFGTVDSWLVWNLTGGVDGGLHLTDVTNASRTMLLNLTELRWDPKLCKFFDIPMSCLPEVRSSSEVYGAITGGPLQGVPIAGVLGDQQAALVGQLCLSAGQAKNTYGTGCFLLYNTGQQVVHSPHGLLTTVAYQFGDAPACYALEGSVAIAGAAVRWLRDNMAVIASADEVEPLAASVPDTAGVYFVPAFSGLYAPYWRPDARGVVCGLSQRATKAHLARAALEAVCYQTREILAAMREDSGVALQRLLVDGGMAGNDLLMQLQADLAGVPVERPTMLETTALGAAMAAGAALGVWPLQALPPPATDAFLPQLPEPEREARFGRWQMAVQRSLGWEAPRGGGPAPDVDSRRTASVSLALFGLGSLVTIILAERLRHPSPPLPGSPAHCQAGLAGVLLSGELGNCSPASVATFVGDNCANAYEFVSKQCVAAVSNEHVQMLYGALSYYYTRLLNGPSIFLENLSFQYGRLALVIKDCLRVAPEYICNYTYSTAQYISNIIYASVVSRLCDMRSGTVAVCQGAWRHVATLGYFACVPFTTAYQHTSDVIRWLCALLYFARAETQEEDR